MHRYLFKKNKYQNKNRQQPKNKNKTKQKTQKNNNNKQYKTTAYKYNSLNKDCSSLLLLKYL